MMIVPSVIISVFMIYNTDKKYSQSLYEDSVRIVASMEKEMETLMNGMVLQNDQLVNNPHITIALKRLMNEEPFLDYRDAINLRNLNAIMSSIMGSYSSITSINFYFQNYQKYYSSGQYYYTTTRIERENLDAIIDQLAAEGKDYTVRNSRDGKSIFLFHSSLGKDGLMFFSIDKEQFRKEMLEKIMNEKITVLFFNSEQEFLLSCNSSLDEAKIPDTLFDGSMEGQWVFIDDGQYMVSSKKNEKFDFYTVALIPQAYFQDLLNAYMKSCYLIVLGCLVVAGVLSYLSARKSYGRIVSIIDLFHEAEQGRYPKEQTLVVNNEYDLLTNNIIYLFLQSMKNRDERNKIEQSMLQLQINPHFLFNTLQDLDFRIRAGKDLMTAGEELETLSDILRYSLKNPAEMVSLKEEIFYLKKYVFIQEVRFRNSIIIYYEIEEALMELQVFRLLLQPLIENSISHGLCRMKGQGYINVEIFEESGTVIFRVSDNGVGMTQERLEQLRKEIENNPTDLHIGLCNLNRRLKVYYGDSVSLQIWSKENQGTCIEFHVSKGLMIKR